MSEENENNKITIDSYIENSNCKINQTRTEYLNGEPIVLQGYKLPRKLVYYNIKNGRFAKEYIKIIREEGVGEIYDFVEPFSKLRYEALLKKIKSGEISGLCNKFSQKEFSLESGALSYKEIYQNI